MTRHSSGGAPKPEPDDAGEAAGNVRGKGEDGGPGRTSPAPIDFDPAHDRAA